MFLCIDLGGSSARAALIDDSGVVDSASDSRVSEFTVSRLDELVDELLGRASITAVSAVGVAVPGVVNRASNSLLSAHGKYELLNGVDLSQWCSRRFGCPFVLENDARAALMGEVTHGVAVGERDAVMMILGTGIGTAAIIDGVLLRGRHDHAGILGGHVTVDIDAPNCPCGNRGCAESLASTWALPSALGMTDLESLFSRADEGDSKAIVLLEGFLDVWGATLVSLCHAYDPQVVVLTGGVVRSADRIVPALSSYLASHLWSSSYRPQIVVPGEPQLSVLRGLSALASATLMSAGES